MFISIAKRKQSDGSMSTREELKGLNSSLICTSLWCWDVS